MNIYLNLILVATKMVKKDWSTTLDTFIIFSITFHLLPQRTSLHILITFYSVSFRQAIMTFENTK